MISATEQPRGYIQIYLYYSRYIHEICTCKYAYKSFINTKHHEDHEAADGMFGEAPFSHAGLWNFTVELAQLCWRAPCTSVVGKYNACTLRIAMENLYVFFFGGGEIHQNVGFFMAMLVYRSVNICTYIYNSCHLCLWPFQNGGSFIVRLTLTLLMIFI